MARSWCTSRAEGRGEATSDRVGDGQKARTSSKDFWPAWGHFPENRHLVHWPHAGHMSPPGRSGSGTAGDNNWREQPYRPTTGSVLVNAVHGNKLLTVTLAPPHSFGRPRSGSARRVVKCRRARSQLGTRQRFTRSNESDRNLVLQRVLGQFPLLAPLPQFLGRLLLVVAQLGQETSVNLVDQRVRVLALVVLD